MTADKSFEFSRMAAALAMAFAAPAAFQSVHAGAGWGDSVDAFNAPIKVPTFYANSPSGIRTTSCFDATGTAATSCDTGTALRKFVDGLPGLGASGANANGQYMPVAVPDTTSYPGSDYYEIAVVEYRERMHSDLANPTTLRGYVQIDPVATFNGSGSMPLFQLDGVTPVMIAKSDPTTHVVVRDATGAAVMTQAFGVDKPHYLGPVILATQGRPTRVKFYNGLPEGHGGVDANNLFHRNGDLFIPTDTTLMGAGDTPYVDPLNPTKTVTSAMAVTGPYSPLNPAVPPVTVANYLQYTQNRELLHLHGGDTPWISDGTPHQWITPAADELAAIAAGKPDIGRGASAVNVPDMPDAGPGAVTYYWPNGQSGRLMFFHDHASGITRLNVYAGAAAGYLLVDPQERALNTTFGLGEIPLVIQDKTFVPKDIAIQDAKWDTGKWGAEGDLWFPHVYETNQDPNSYDGTNPVGRWDWGPYFWPVFPANYALPDGSYGNATTTPEAFMDTPVVNGTAYPTIVVQPQAYRMRILNAANDRAMNLGLYLAADKVTTNPTSPTNPLSQPTLCDGVSVRPTDGTMPAPTDCTEVKMVNFDTSYPSAYYPVGSASVVTPNGQLSFPDGTVPATAGLMGTGWGTPNAMMFPMGVPDPATAGPPIIRIGTEGGLLPAAAAIPSTPVNYEYNKRSVTVLNLQERGLWINNAERADVVVDFSQYAGKTLILYNDAPAPMPAGDPRIDYYTGNGDNTGSGGAPNTLPGYGPNTRTIMQIQVANATPAPALDVAALSAAVSSAYAATQPKPVVPETAYNAAFPGIATSDTFARIYTGSIYLNAYRPLTYTTPEAITYTQAPVCSSASTCATAPRPIVTAAAGTTISAYVESKAIQELFDPDYGRMNATLGVELPFTSSLVQTTIPLGYIDPATETIADGETQFWKITHNGVDTHPVHFHLLNVQLINRVGWDGTLKPPAADEVGWKETVRMHPLEDVIVAVRPRTPQIPFGVMNSNRMMAPSLPAGTAMGFTQVDPATGNPATVINKLSNYQWEYVWHCHILGHEENDFMRPMVFNYKAVAPLAPVLAPLTNTITDASAAAPVPVALSWTDPTPAATSMGNKANEAGLKIMRAPVVAGKAGTYVQVGTAPANATAFTDNVTTDGIYSYRVDAFNGAGVTPSNTVQISIGSLLPVGDLSVVMTSTSSAVLRWTDLSAAETGYVVQGSTDGTNWAMLATLPASPGVNGAMSYTALQTFNAYVNYRTRVIPINGALPNPPAPLSNVASLDLTKVPAAPTGIAATAAGLVTWNDNSNNNSSFTLQVRSRRTSASTWSAWSNVSTTIGANATSYAYTQPISRAGYQFQFQVRAVNARGPSPWNTMTGTVVLP